jgi:hypothetical protein
MSCVASTSRVTPSRSSAAARTRPRSPAVPGSAATSTVPLKALSCVNTSGTLRSAVSTTVTSAASETISAPAPAKAARTDSSSPSTATDFPRSLAGSGSSGTGTRSSR